MSGLYFETATAVEPPHPNRNDVACFIGYVARRKGAALPASTLAELRAGGWVDGPWQRDAQSVADLEQLPVTIESWTAFDQLFAWDQRPLSEGQAAVCACYLGVAVRSFFATGGRRAVIIRVADPWPYVEADAQHQAKRIERLRRLLPGFPNVSFPLNPKQPTTSLPLDPYNPSTWQGLQHLYGLAQVSMVCLPDLPDLLSVSLVPSPAPLEAPAFPEVFVECSDNEPPLLVDRGLQRLSAPRCDNNGFALWALSIRLIRDVLKRYRPDSFLVGTIPFPHAEAGISRDGSAAHAEVDMLGFLRSVGGLDQPEDTNGNGPTPSTFSQLAYPWLRTRRSSDLPENIEPPDGLLAGLLAANALRRGTFRSVAGSLLPDVVETKPPLAWGVGPDSPAQQLAEWVCLIAPEPDGIAVQSDVTTSSDIAWRSGGARRLMDAVLRAARAAGDDYVFEPNGPRLWSRVQRGMEELLSGFWREGGLGGSSLDEAFSVRCDRSTMSQNDVDGGRIIVLITVLPVAAVERITIVLKLEGGGSGVQTDLREVA